MCKVSDKLKLCTCKTENVERLKNYWILYKYHKSDIVLMGLQVLPQEYHIGKECNDFNYIKLETMLNAENCFDIDLIINSKDILELNFSCHSTEGKENINLVYEFIYKNNKWQQNECDPFDTDKLEKHKGKITNAFAKTK